MHLQLERLTSDSNSTLSALFVNGKFFCWCCEDEFRQTKVPKETRIYAGTYHIKLRSEGGMHADYAKRFPGIHKGMLWLYDCPTHEFVYLHIGNTEKDTDGCPLVGFVASVSPATGGGTVGQSTDAYLKLYPVVRDALVRGEAVTITVLDRDR